MPKLGLKLFLFYENEICPHGYDQCDRDWDYSRDITPWEDDHKINRQRFCLSPGKETTLVFRKDFFDAIAEGCDQDSPEIDKRCVVVMVWYWSEEKNAPVSLLRSAPKPKGKRRHSGSLDKEQHWIDYESAGFFLPANQVDWIFRVGARTYTFNTDTCP